MSDNVQDYIYKMLYEYSYQWVRGKVDTASRSRAKKLHSDFISINKRSVCQFRTESGTTPGIFWKQWIELLDLSSLMKQADKSLTDIDRVRLAVKGNIKVYCDCPAFLYWGWAYMTTQRNLNYGEPENRKPKVRNPEQKGMVCKHLDNVLLVFPFLSSTILKQYRKL